MQLITYDQVKSKIIEIRNQKVTLDSDVAELYSVETREINQAIKRNSDKFPDGYLIELTPDEWGVVKSQFVISPMGGGKVKLPVAFTERGLYMLATILKSPRAVATTIAIIDTFAKLKELMQNIHQMYREAEPDKLIHAFKNSSDLASNLLTNPLTVSQDETMLKFKLPFFEITRKITKEKNK